MQERTSTDRQPRGVTGRARKKEDKRRRIRAAATHLFRTRGYEATTTREIAEGAGIAVGTLFLYVRDKDEALALMFGDDVDRVLAEPPGPVRAGFATALARRLRALYALYAREPELALRFVRRLPSLEDAERERHEVRNACFSALIRAELERARRRNELRDDLDLERATATVFAVVRVMIFSWLARPPADVEVEAGLRELVATLQLLVRGLGA